MDIKIVHREGSVKLSVMWWFAALFGGVLTFSGQSLAFHSLGSTSELWRPGQPENVGALLVELHGVTTDVRQPMYLALNEVPPARSVSDHMVSPQKIADGVWFLIGDKSKGYCNTIVIEMADYLIVVDANYPGRAKELLQVVKTLSSKPVKYVF